MSLLLSRKLEKADQSLLKYVGTLKDDIDKLAPKMKQHFTKVERIVTQAAYDTDAEKLGIAIRLNQDFNSYNEYVEWIGRLLPKEKKSKDDKPK